LGFQHYYFSSYDKCFYIWLSKEQIFLNLSGNFFECTGPAQKSTSANHHPPPPSWVGLKGLSCPCPPLTASESLQKKIIWEEGQRERERGRKREKRDSSDTISYLKKRKSKGGIWSVNYITLRMKIQGKFPFVFSCVLYRSYFLFFFWFFRHTHTATYVHTYVYNWFLYNLSFSVGDFWSCSRPKILVEFSFFIAYFSGAYLTNKSHVRKGTMKYGCDGGRKCVSGPHF